MACGLRTANHSCSFSGLLTCTPKSNSWRKQPLDNNFFDCLGLLEQSQGIITISGKDQSENSNWASTLCARLYGKSCPTGWAHVKMRPIKGRAYPLLGYLHLCQQQLGRGVPSDYAHSTIMQTDWLQLSLKQWRGWWKLRLCPTGAEQLASHLHTVSPSNFLVLITKPFFSLLKYLASLFINL